MASPTWLVRISNPLKTRSEDYRSYHSSFSFKNPLLLNINKTQQTEVNNTIRCEKSKFLEQLLTYDEIKLQHRGSE